MKVFGDVDPNEIVEALHRDPADAIPLRNRLSLNQEFVSALLGQRGQLAKEGAREIWDHLNTAEAVAREGIE